MRIVAGRWRGRTITAPPGRGTRPTSDRVREALFDVLASRMGPDLGEGAVLDLFAGSGALGLEALSRGAGRAVMVESDRGACKVLQANIDALDADERATVLCADAMGAGLPRALAAGPFALLLLDPPYRIEAAEVGRLLDRVAAAGGLGAGAYVAAEHASASPAPAPESLEHVRTYRYGDTAISLYKATEGEARS